MPKDLVNGEDMYRKILNRPERKQFIGKKQFFFYQKTSLEKKLIEDLSPISPCKCVPLIPGVYNNYNDSDKIESMASV